MNLCRVLGTVVATEKHPAFVGRKLLLVQPLDERQAPLGKSFIAVDGSSSAGEGDLVLVMREGGGVRQVLKDKTLPIRSLIVGVVDQIAVDEPFPGLKRTPQLDQAIALLQLSPLELAEKVREELESNPIEGAPPKGRPS